RGGAANVAGVNATPLPCARACPDARPPPAGTAVTTGVPAAPSPEVRASNRVPAAPCPGVTTTAARGLPVRRPTSKPASGSSPPGTTTARQQEVVEHVVG